MKTTISYKKILSLSIPIIAGSAIDTLTAIIDTAFLGRLGPVALGASALGGIFYLALIMIGFGFGSGAQIIISRRYGEKKFPEIGRTLQHAAMFLVPLSLIFITLLFFFAKSTMKGFLESDDVFQSLSAYLDFRIWGLLFAYINILFKAFYIGTFRSKIVGISSIVIALVNIFLDYVLIFGHFGMPAMGIGGAALASVIAEASGMLFFLFYTLGHKGLLQFEIQNKFGFDWGLMKRIFKLGSPLMAQFFLSFGAWFVFFILIEKLGEIPLAVSNLVRTVYMIVLLPLFGYASATNTLVSYKIGEGAIAEVGPLARKILKLSILSTVALSAIMVIFYKSYFSLYTTDRDLIEACYPVLLILCICATTLSVGIIMYNVVSGAGKTMVTLTIEFFVIVGYVMWTYVAVNILESSTAIVWLAEAWYGSSMAIGSVLYLKFGNWKKGKV